MDIAAIHQKIIEGIQNYFRENNFKNAVIGVSGGLDSSVVLKLLADAVGPENIIAITMPETGITAAENMMHAKTLCEFLGVKSLNHPINNYMLTYATLPWKQGDTANANTKARVRATILYNFANTHNALVVGASNKSGLILGYGTKYGDLAADIFPIGDLYKTEVFTLADFMEMPKEIIEKTPTMEMYLGQTDEADLGGKYEDIDVILKQHELGEDMLIEKGMNAVLVRKIFQRMKANKHKLITPYIVKISGE